MILAQSQNRMAIDNIGSGALFETDVKLRIASKESLFTENVQESVSTTKQLSVVANTSSEPEATALETSVKYLIRAPAPETPTSTTLEQEIKSMLDQVTKMATQKTNKVLKNPVTLKQKDKIFDAASFIESSLESEKKRRGVKVWVVKFCIDESSFTLCITFVITTRQFAKFPLFICQLS
jgi:hypothetical protein